MKKTLLVLIGFMLLTSSVFALEVGFFLDICETHESKGEPIAVHCYAGCGRTGTMLALWLMKNDDQFDDRSEIIDYIRIIRPCSIETTEQENVILNYSE